MADELTSTGLSIDSMEMRLARIKAALRAAISPILDLSPDQPTGQIVLILTEHLQEVAELLQEIHTSFDPDQASGAALDGLCQITGTYRHAATYGTVTLTLTASGPCTVPAGSLVAVAGDPDNQWATTEDVVFAAAGSQDVTARCTQAGAVQALAGTLTVIVTPVANWTSVTNASDATVGAEEETDTELRLRREQEVTLSGSASVDSIQAEISALTGVEQVTVYENATDHAGAPISGYPISLPPHSIECLFWSLYTGSDLTSLYESIAEAIHSTKPAGIDTYGDHEETVTDDAGNDHTIRMTLATSIAPTVDVYLDVDVETYVGDSEVKSAIQSWHDEHLTIGEDILRSRITAICMGLNGVENVTGVYIGGVGMDYSIDARSIGRVLTAYITVHS